MRLLVVLAGLLVAGCAGGAFSHSFDAPADPGLSGVLRAIEEAAPRQRPAVVVAVTADPPGLLFFDLRTGARRWAVETEVLTTPILAGPAVVTTEGAGRIVARSVEDGRVLFNVEDEELRLVGADGEGDRVLIALARGEGESPRGLVVGGSSAGAHWQEDLPLPVGDPAVAGGIAVVPWAHQRVSFLDATNGQELARIRLSDTVAGHAFRHDRSVIVGQHELLRVTPQIQEANRSPEDVLEPPARPLPGLPPMMRDGYEGRFAIRHAYNRVRLIWALREGRELGLAEEGLGFAFYRIVFGLHHLDDEVRWITALPSDVVGASAAHHGILVATEAGELVYLQSSDGRPAWRAELGAPVVAAEIEIGDFEPDGSVEGELEPLPDQLRRVATLDDARLGAARALAIRHLARFADEEVTEELIALCADRSPGAAPARRAACDALSERTSGGPQVRRALEERASFLEDRPAPPVGSLARAAANMGIRNSVVLLIRHLEDPATPRDELVRLFEGLGRLGDRRAVAPIESYLRLYHADATDALDVEVLGAAAEALLQLDGTRFSIVEELSSDPLAPEPARSRLAEALTASRREENEEPTTAAEPAPRDEATPPPEEELPERITSEMRHAVFEPLEPRLRRCLQRTEGEPHPSARIVLTVRDDGRPGTVTVTPSALSECVEPLVRGLSFPRTQRGREALIHIVRD